MNIRGTHSFKVLTVLAAAGALLLGGTILGAVQMSSASVRSTTYYACVSKVGGDLYHVNTARPPRCDGKGKVVTWNQIGPAGPGGHAGPSGAAGANGTDGINGANGINGTDGRSGTNGTNGTNGASVITSSIAPSSPCTSGNTDVELDSGEVWTCTSSAWTDTGSSIKGPAGASGVAYDCSATPYSGIDLASCNLSNTDLTGANLIGANLVGANVGGANLSGASLLGADLTGAYAVSVNLDGAQMQDANLTGADLQGAILTVAQLHDANMYGANLSGANLTLTNLTGDNGLTIAALSGAFYFDTTCPDGTVTFPANLAEPTCNADLSP